MTSNSALVQAYVWTWLPGHTDPVVAGKLVQVDTTLVFNYGQTYLDRDDAIPLYTTELPLNSGELPLKPGLSMPGCLRDAAPDAWGRRVILNRLLGQGGREADVATLSELTYLLESGSDRIGALDFQRSPDQYVARSSGHASLDDLLAAADKVEAGIPLAPEIDVALHHGSSIGGARPKALLDDGERKLVAKFASSNDVYSVVKAEFVAMRLASLCGMSVADVELASASKKDILLIKRFDRIATEDGWQRRAMISALTLFELDEMMARYASYEDLAEIVRHQFAEPKKALQELFERLVFNILCSNTDDHARNHASFWDGKSLSFTPAYDICPQPRAGNEASQSMKIVGENNLSQISVCLQAAAQFLLSQDDAADIVASQLSIITEHWDEVCSFAALSDIDRTLLSTRQFINPFAFEELTGSAQSLKALADESRLQISNR